MASNLLKDSDFLNGTMVRFVSYIDPDIVLGLTAPRVQTYNNYLTNRGVGVRHRSKLGNSNEGVWMIASDQGTGLPASECIPGFQIVSNAQSNLYLTNIENNLYTALSDVQPPDVNCGFWFVDWVKDGTWFALNNKDHSRVFDISRSDTTEGNDVILFPWNGGDNQVWRAERA